MVTKHFFLLVKRAKQQFTTLINKAQIILLAMGIKAINLGAFDRSRIEALQEYLERLKIYAA